MSKRDDSTFEGYLDQQMLIAMPGMSDPNFVRSVTLLCQHSGEGAIGIMINRESGFTMGEILAQLNLDCDDPSVRDRPVLEGGPVAGERGFVLHTPMEGFESSILINPDVMITTSRDVLAAIAAGRGPERYVMALGYAGWGDGQLENEMRENAWLSVPADSAIIFDLPLKDRWTRAVSALGIDIRNLHDMGGHA